MKMKNNKFKLRLSVIALMISLLLTATAVQVFADTETTAAASQSETVPSETSGTEKADNTETTASEAKDADSKNDDGKKITVNEETEIKTSIWGYIAIPFSYVMQVCNIITGNIYVLALLLFAVFMKAVLFPFGIKQQKNMVKQASLRPQEQAIRKKYAGRTDKATQQKQQQEIMDLYQRENYNPASGCLPLLLQFPILFALYQVVYNPLRYVLHLGTDKIRALMIALQNAGFDLSSINADRTRIIMKNNTFSNFSDLYIIKPLSEYFDKLAPEAQKIIGTKSSLPKFSFLGMDLTRSPSEAKTFAYLLIPILTFVCVFLSMKLTRKFSYQPQQDAATGASMKFMDLVMPLFSTFIAFTFPAILGIYWIYQNILGVVQQMILKKMYPIPEFTEEDYAAAERQYFGKAEKKMKEKVFTDEEYDPRKAGGGNRKKSGKSNYESTRPKGRLPEGKKSLHYIDEDDEIPELPERPERPADTSGGDNDGGKPSKGSGLIDPAPLKDDENHNKDKN